MRTWEMIKELTENLDKKFKTNNCNFSKECIAFMVTDGSDNEIFCSYDNGPPELLGLNTGKTGKGTLKWEWEEVIEPVDFLTAYKDCLENGTKYIVKGQHDTIASIYNVNGDVQIHTLVHGFTLSDKWIKKV